MFITFKSSNGQKRSAAAAMEQVAARNARSSASANAPVPVPAPAPAPVATAQPSASPSDSPNSPATHPLRRPRPASRPPCIACYSKKIQCTGRFRDCDRCIARSQACLFPMTRPQMRRRQTPQSITDSASLSASAHASGDSSQSPAVSPTDDIDLMSTQSNNSHTFPTTSTSHAVPLRQEALMDHDPDHDGGFDDLQHKMYSNIDFFSQFGLQPEQQHALPVQSAGTTQNGHSQGQGQDSIFAPGFPTMANLGFMGIQQPPTPPGSAISSVGGTTAGTFPHNGSMDTSMLKDKDKDKAPTNPSQCACLNDQLRSIQQLDDDHFHITTLSLDQVLQLQKMLMAQCDNSLRCSACQPLPTVHSVLVIICDRLTEMFECIHKRLKRLHQHLADNEEATVQGQGESEGHANYPAQLFCGSTGEIAGMAACNTALFKPAFQDSYSHMEQIHMMKGLLSMQVKNFQDLLVRVRSPIQAWGSQARLSKVASLLSRMERAGANIDDVLQAILDETM